MTIHPVRKLSYELCTYIILSDADLNPPDSFEEIECSHNIFVCPIVLVHYFRISDTVEKKFFVHGVIHFFEFHS